MAQYYVTKVASSDSYNGLYETYQGGSDGPWLTIGKATTVLTAGDSVQVNAGTYNERIAEATPGSLGNLITYQGKSGDTVLTQGFVLDGNYIRVDDFEIETDAATYSTNGIGIWLRASYCEIEDNYIHNCSWRGIHMETAKTSSTIKNNYIYQCAEAGIWVSGTNHTVEDNEIDDIRSAIKSASYADANGMSIFDTGQLIKGNYIHDCLYSNNSGSPHIDGFQTWSGGTETSISDSTIEGNMVWQAEYDTATSKCVGFMCEEGSDNLIIKNNIFYTASGILFGNASNIYIYNNTFRGNIDCPPAITPRGLHISNCSNMTFKNNIIFDFNEYAVWQGGSTGLTYDYQAYWMSDDSTPALSGVSQQGNDLWKQDPKFVTEFSDLHLQSDSPCVDAGVDLSGTVDDDYDGNSRPQGVNYDIGAFEYITSGQIISAVGNISSTEAFGSSLLYFLNRLYAKGREAFLGGDIDWANDTIKAVLVDSADYTLDLAAHEFLDDIPAAGQVAISGALSGKSTTLGVADASDITITTVSGDKFEYIILFKDTGDSATSPLIMCIDSAVGLPFTPEGGSVKLKWSDLVSKIFKL